MPSKEPYSIDVQHQQDPHYMATILIMSTYCIPIFVITKLQVLLAIAAAFKTRFGRDLVNKDSFHAGEMSP